MTKLRRYVNIFLVAATFGSWLAVFFFGTGSLVQNGIGSLKYFTMLSNLFAGAVAIAWLANTRNGGADGSGCRASERIERLKYIAAASVGLTFAVVAGFLGPLYGYKEMFSGFNLPLHLIAPLTAMAEIIFLTDTEYTRRDNILAVIPPFLYGVAYLANIIINSRGEWPDTNDWYWFFAWGYPVGMLIYAGILAVTWLIGLMLRKLQRKRDN